VSEPVLDASAFLALLNKEPGHEQVIAVLPAASIGTVSLTELISKLCVAEARLANVHPVPRDGTVASSLRNQIQGMKHD
jgi:PIN domain nuclease of toxin-antitoxin system